MITITAFKWVPPFAQGLVRDLRARWALNEIGEPYEVRLLGMGEHKQPAHLAHQPFGQVPTYEEDGLSLFESGAMVLHIAGKKPGVLLPENPAPARAITWMFAALNSVEPYANCRHVRCLRGWHAEQKPGKARSSGHGARQVEQIVGPFGDARLSGRRRVYSRRSVDVGHIAHRAGIRNALPQPAAYRERCEARPAFQKALADQLAPFEKYAPAAA